MHIGCLDQFHDVLEYGIALAFQCFVFVDGTEFNALNGLADNHFRPLSFLLFVHAQTFSFQ